MTRKTLKQVLYKEEKMFTIRNEYDKFSTKTFRIPREITEKLDKLAKEHNTSVNKVVIQCLEYAIDNLENSN